MVSQSIWRRVVGSVLTNISPSNIFINMLWLEKLIKIVRLFLDAMAIKGLTWEEDTHVYIPL